MNFKIGMDDSSFAIAAMLLVADFIYPSAAKEAQGQGILVVDWDQWLSQRGDGAMLGRGRLCSLEFKEMWKKWCCSSQMLPLLSTISCPDLILEGMVMVDYIKKGSYQRTQWHFLGTWCHCSRSCSRCIAMVYSTLGCYPRIDDTITQQDARGNSWMCNSTCQTWCELQCQIGRTCLQQYDDCIHVSSIWTE